MALLRSVLVSIAALTVAALAAAVPLIVLNYRFTMSHPAGDDSYFFVLHWRMWPILCVSLLLCVSLPVFATGFYWQYRRAP
jgi:hypothetical protein